jgi:hypothetical protein
MKLRLGTIFAIYGYLLFVWYNSSLFFPAPSAFASFSMDQLSDMYRRTIRIAAPLSDRRASRVARVDNPLEWRLRS